jgi:hypothetical protein
MVFYSAWPSSSVHAPGYWRNFKSWWIRDETSGSYRINSSSTQTDLASVFAFCAHCTERYVQQNDVGWPSAYLIRINTLYTLDDFPHLWAREKIIVVHNVPLDIKLYATAANTRRCEIERSEEKGDVDYTLCKCAHTFYSYSIFN